MSSFTKIIVCKSIQWTSKTEKTSIIFISAEIEELIAESGRNKIVMIALEKQTMEDSVGHKKRDQSLNCCIYQ